MHGALLGYSATRHSPTMDEPAHLVAGISHWQYGRFEVYRVNPPLVRMVAALPVLCAGCKTDWTQFVPRPRSRCEFPLGDDFVRANGERSLWLFTIARWSCMPFSVFGGFISFLWSRELWKNDTAGLLAAGLWCIEPNIMAHAELITPDCAASAFGLAACYTFWRWLKTPTATRAFIAGTLLGAAELSKTTWVILLGLFPLLWLAWDGAPLCRALLGRLSGNDSNRAHGPDSHHVTNRGRRLFQLAGILVWAVYIVNLGYGFDGAFTRLNEYAFTCHALTGLETGTEGNRFVSSVLGEAPIPFPREFVQGIDVQRRDLEKYPWWSYLRGRWSDHGWWHYYLYALAVKTTHGMQLLLVFVAAGLAITRFRNRLKSQPPGCDVMHEPAETTHGSCLKPGWRDLLVLSAPALVVLILVSSQTGFNHHLRYILPVFGFAFVFIGGAAECWRYMPRAATAVVFGCLVASAFSSLRIFPDSITYFNELAGGPDGGHKHLLGSNLDWGQDLVAFRDWAARADGQIYLVYWGGILAESLLPADVAQRVILPPQKPTTSEFFVAISQNYVSGDNRPLETKHEGSLGVHRVPIKRYSSAIPIDRVGRTILVFRGSEGDFND